MNKIPMSPKARTYAKENNIDIASIDRTGKDGNVRYVSYSDVKNIKVTPLAAKIAQKSGIDVNNIKTAGTVTKKDVLKYAEDLDSKKAYRLSSAREMIAENLSKSVKETIPYTLFAKVDITSAYKYYEKIKNDYDVKITLTDIFTSAVSKALKDNLIINTTRKDGYYIENDNVNICLAMDLGGSIITPVMKNSDALTIHDIAKLRVSFFEKVSSGKITSEDLSDGTFTISNLGQSPVGHFTPVLNYPQSGILGIGRTDDELYLENGEVKVRKVSHLSLTVDHAVIDGKVASLFLKDIERYLSSEV